MLDPARRVLRWRQEDARRKHERRVKKTRDAGMSDAGSGMPLRTSWPTAAGSGRVGPSETPTPGRGANRPPRRHRPAWQRRGSRRGGTRRRRQRRHERCAWSCHRVGQRVSAPASRPARARGRAREQAPRMRAGPRTRLCARAHARADSGRRGRVPQFGGRHGRCTTVCPRKGDDRAA